MTDRKIINDLDFQNSQKVKNALDPSDPQDYVTLAYGDANYTGGGSIIGVSELIYKYTVTGSDKASIDTGADTPDAGSNDWTGGDLLEIWFYSRTDESATNVGFDCVFNNDTSSIYERVYITMTNTSVAGANDTAAASLRLNSLGSNGGTSIFALNRITIPNYAGTVGHKSFEYIEGAPNTTASSARTLAATGNYRSTSAITRAKMACLSTQKFKVGTQLLIYKRRSS